MKYIRTHVYVCNQNRYWCKRKKITPFIWKSSICTHCKLIFIQHIHIFSCPFPEIWNYVLCHLMYNLYSFDIAMYLSLSILQPHAPTSMYARMLLGIYKSSFTFWIHIINETVFYQTTPYNWLCVKPPNQSFTFRLPTIIFHYKVWARNFGWVLWPIDPCRLFNAISC